ncbi:hypothetical protein [Pleomorphomonas carboxyditropha]|uniref:Uncharacterized protein n=1 Tax=Pleomorphomonas carboxyditropha TaxID=2023338 RepID=A0A2G9X128_9HYPH|nr:hypothetical protein [Pleomorphomonas carboxyditropha]PIP00678.1 hypothetical protein CJ014_00815 [Pleomorphomonas carboxyditropha]
MRIVIVKDGTIKIAHFASQEAEVLQLYADCEIGRYSGVAKPGSEIDPSKYTKLRDPLMPGAAS